MQLLIKIVKNFIKNDGSYRAAALAYTSLLSLVPFTAVMLAVLSYFPFFDQIRTPLRELIFKNFMPASGQIVQSHIMDFVEHASALPTVGGLFLVFTVILMIQEIETAINTIWQDPKRRSFSRSILFYGGLIAIAPLVIALIFMTTTLALSSDWLSHHQTLSKISEHVLLPAIPFLLTFGLLLFFYRILPRRRVKLRHAALGAGFATIVLEVSKWGFGWYLDRYNTYEVIYGAFAAIPIVLVWIYWLWMVVLMGAELTYVRGQVSN